MPKGALLHAHLDATVDVKFLLELALKEPAMHIRVPSPLTAQNSGSVLPEFSALPPELHNFQGPDLTSESYTSNSWVNISKARETFAFGGSQGFDQWVVDAMMIRPAEAYETHNTITKVPSFSAVHFVF
jgi:adenosine deaminase CECR1